MAYAREDYTPYYYLWHLIALGVLKASPPPVGGGVGGSGGAHLCPVIEKAIWDHSSLKDRPAATVALIDMGVARHHPNLSAHDGSTQQIDWAQALDLASHRFGATYRTSGASHLETRKQHLGAINVNTGSPNAQEAPILQELQNGLGVERTVTAYDQRYATHGTACAGLVCGTTDNADHFGEQGNIAVYYGVDPFSKIVPITTSISPDPYQLIAAFLYAQALNVDVILLPRDFGDPAQTPGFATELDAEEKTRLDEGSVDIAWHLLGKIVIDISQDIPIVCAAGNDGRSSLIYPASRSGQAGNGVISVGAVSYAGYRSGYSNYGPGLTVVAPSDDGEVYNRHQIRLDKKSVDFADYWVDGVHQPPIDEIPFSPERLITLDVPGPRGYADGSRQGPVTSRAEAVDDPASLYTEFGGTSGASALLAGICALMQRQNKPVRLSGPTVKSTLTAATNLDLSDWYWRSNPATSLQGDEINGAPAPTEPELFGQGGLVNAASLLGIDWNDINS